MKVMVTGNAAGLDLSSLRAEVPAIDLSAARAVDEVALEMRDAEVLVISNRVYTAPRWFGRPTPTHRLFAGSTSPTSGIDKALKTGGFPAGVQVTHSAGLRAASVSEHVFALLLFLACRFRAVEAGRRRREWVRDEVTPAVVSLQRQTLVMLGMGAIGQAMARKARAFEMRVITVSRTFDADRLARPSTIATA